jgi:hypothetical protein
MTTIFERVSTALSTLSPAVPFALAPYKSTGTLPDTYIAYQLITSPPEAHADNRETARSYLVQISIYRRGGLVSLPDVDTAMIGAGFVKGDCPRILKPDTSASPKITRFSNFLCKGAI